MSSSTTRRRARRSESVQLGESSGRPQKQQRRDLTSEPISPVPKTRAVICIDLGMTSSRIVLAPVRVPYRQRPTSICIVPRPPALASKMYIPHQVKDGEFPNLALVFDTGLPLDDCLMFVAPGNAIGVPVKTFFYAQYLVKYHNHVEYTEIREPREEIIKMIDEAKIKIQSILVEIPQLEPFWGKYLTLNDDERKSIMQHFRNIFKAHLQLISEQSQDEAERRRLEVTDMVVSTPPNWDHCMEHEYVTLLEEVWHGKIRSRNIDVISEVDAEAHWFASRQLERWFDGECHPYLVVDWGGHTMSCYSFDIYGNKAAREISFFRTGKYTCHHGGPEHYESLLSRTFKERVARECPELSDQERAHMLESGLDHYRRIHRGKINRGSFKIKASKDMESPDRIFEFTERESKIFYTRAYGRLIDIFKKVLKKIKGIAANTNVVLFGGTFMIEGLRQEFERLIRNDNFHYDPAGQSGNPPDQRPYSVAQGTAFARQTKVPVRKGIAQTSFAVNIRGPNGRIPIIMRGGETVLARAVVSKKDEEDELDGEDENNVKGMVRVEISGTPRVPNDETSGLNFDKTYCLRSVLFSEGEYDLGLGFVKDGQHPSQGMLFLRTHHVRGPRGGRRVKKHDTESQWPIYFDIGQGVIKIDIDRLNENPEGPPKEDGRVLRSATYRARRELTAGNWTDGLELYLKYTMLGDDAARIFRENTEQLEVIGPTGAGPWSHPLLDREIGLGNTDFLEEDDGSDLDGMEDLEEMEDWEDARGQSQPLTEYSESSFEGRSNSQPARANNDPRSQTKSPVGLRTPTASQPPLIRRTPKDSELPFRQAASSSGITPRLRDFVPRKLNIFRS